jgi:hypothetical protein
MCSKIWNYKDNSFLFPHLKHSIKAVTVSRTHFWEFLRIIMVISSFCPDIRLFSESGIRPDIRQVKSDIRPDTGYQKLNGRI